MNNKLTKNSSWKVGDKVRGIYYGAPFTGKLSKQTRPTPDYKNMQFVVILDMGFTLFGNERKSGDIIYILTKDTDDNYIEMV